MSTVQFASFYMGDELYGINILQIREVLKQPTYSPVPQCPDIVLGLMNLRGQIVTLIDTARSLGLDQEEQSQTCIILKTDDEMGQRVLSEHWVEIVGPDTVGLLVDRMGEVLDVDVGDIDASPANATETQSDFVAGVAKLDEELMTLLCLERVLAI